MAATYCKYFAPGDGIHVALLQMQTNVNWTGLHRRVIQFRSTAITALEAIHARARKDMPKYLAIVKVRILMDNLLSNDADVTKSI